MSPENYTAAAGEFFEAILDNTCNRLQDMQTQYTVRRLIELDSILGNIERELDALIDKQTRLKN